MSSSRSRLSDLSYIPVGRQIPRTPPALDCVQKLDFSETLRNENYDPNSTANLRTPPIRKGSTDGPESMVKGMKGYQLTAADLEFMQKLKEEKEIKSLQNEVATLENELKSQQMALELVLASKTNAEAELKQFPSPEDLRTWALVVLENDEPSSSLDLTDLDIRELLALVTKGTLNKVLKEKRLVQLKNLEDLLEQKKKAVAKDQEQMEKLIAAEQSKVLELMRTLAEKKSSLAQQQEANKSLKMDPLPETKAQGKSLKSGAKEKENGDAKIKSPEDHANQGKSTRVSHQSNIQTDKTTKTTERAKRAMAKREPASQTKTTTRQDGEGTSKRTAADSQAKDVKNTERPTASKRVQPKPKETQHVGKSGVGKSDVGKSGVGKSGVGKSGVGKSGVGKSGVGKSGVGKSDVGKSDVGKSDVGKSDVGKSDVTPVAVVHSGARSRKKVSIQIPAEDQDLVLRRSKRIACRK